MAEGRQINGDAEIRRILEETRAVAVIGMKKPGQGPAYSVPQYLQARGYEIFPVNPGLDDPLLGVEPVAQVDRLDAAVDLVLVFRRAEAVPGHVDQILAMDPLPKTVWMQSGIRNARAAQQLNAAGIDVVQDRCIMVDHRRMG